MHKTKIGEFNYLVVVIQALEEHGHNHILCDKDQEAADFTFTEINKVKKDKATIMIFKEVNYLLDKMAKNKMNRQGKILYDLYIDIYPDGDQKDKVIEFWNK